MAKKNNQILVERETFEKNDKTYFSHQDKHTPRLQMAFLHPIKW